MKELKWLFFPLSSKYFIVIGRDCASYYHYNPPVWVFAGDTANQKSIPSPWKHELLSLLQSLFLKEN